MLSGKNTVFGRKTESGGDSISSRRVSTNCRGLWLVICVERGLLGSEEKGSVLSPNRPPVRCMDRDTETRSLNGRLYLLVSISFRRYFSTDPVDALLSTLQGTLHLILSDQVTWDGPVQLRCCFLLDAAQTCLQTQTEVLLGCGLKSLFFMMFTTSIYHKVHLNLISVLLGGPVTVVFLLPLQELAEVFLYQEGCVELSNGDFILYSQ